MAIAVKQKPKATIHHKRRHGAHQKRSTRFTKAYWPYLPLLFIVGIGLLINTSIGHTASVLGYATNTTTDGLLANTNVQREQNKLTDLTISPDLTRAAQAKADDMVKRNYWSHTTPDGKQPWTFIDKTGYHYQAAGENLAYGFATSANTITGWMNSPGHRANILNSTYQQIGFGIANSTNYQDDGQQTVVVAMYALPAAQTAAAPAASAQGNQPIAVDANTDTSKLNVSAVVPGQTKVARIQIATSGAAPWSIYAISMVGILLVVLFIGRHSLAWHKVLIRGEAFIVKHKVLDVLLVSGVMIGFILSRTAGFIQ